MASTSRGNAVPTGFQSKSTPNLPTLRSLSSLDSSEHRGAPSPQSPAARGASLDHFPRPSGEDQRTEKLASNGFLDGNNDSSSSSDSDSNNSSPHLRPLYTSRSTTQLPRAPSNLSTNLFPPFYNRPPVPLPPSPSLTSLLRPSFSANPSRPSTPDSSDIDLPQRPSTGTSNNGASSGANGTSTPNLASITKSARHAPTVPRASPKVPTYEYYGFALYLASSAAFLMYVLWAYVPSPLLHQMGIHYYPNRWWALAVPSWLVMLVIWIYVALASYNTRYLTLGLTRCENMVDECGMIAVVDQRTKKIVRGPGGGGTKGKSLGEGKGKGKKADAARSRSNSLEMFQFSDEDEVDWKGLWSTGTDAVLDVPIGGVCEILYGAGREF